MYITYSAYRSKNNDFIDRRTISLPIGDFRQLLNLDGIILSVIKEDMVNLKNVDRFGTAYVGDIRCERFEIVDEDNTDAMNEEQFREYFKEISNVPLVWSKKGDVKSAREDTNEESKHEAREENRESIEDKQNTKQPEQHLF